MEIGLLRECDAMKKHSLTPEELKAALDLHQPVVDRFKICRCVEYDYIHTVGDHEAREKVGYVD